MFISQLLNNSHEKSLVLQQVNDLEGHSRSSLPIDRPHIPVILIPKYGKLLVESHKLLLLLLLLTNVMMSLARSRARSGETKHASPFNATPASYMFWLLRSCSHHATATYL